MQLGCKSCGPFVIGLFVFSSVFVSVSIGKGVAFTKVKDYKNGEAGWLFVPEKKDSVLIFKNNKEQSLFYATPIVIDGLFLDKEPEVLPRGLFYWKSDADSLVYNDRVQRRQHPDGIAYIWDTGKKAYYNYKILEEKKRYQEQGAEVHPSKSVANWVSKFGSEQSIKKRIRKSADSIRTEISKKLTKQAYEKGKQEGLINRMRGYANNFWGWLKSWF